jgi:ribonuclease HI
MQHFLYTDGSFNPNLNLASIGGYIIDENQNVLFEFSESISDSYFFKYHELLALKKGLTLALDNNIKNLICLSDDIFIRFFNNLDILSLPSFEINKKNLIIQILQLKSQFDLIDFKFIERKFNKKADKLAEQTQIKYFYENIFFKERFEIKSTKFLNIPNLICIEDFYNSKPSEHQLLEYSNNIAQLSHFSDFHLELHLKSINKDYSEATLINKFDNSFQQITFETKKVNSHCIALLTNYFLFLNPVKSNSLSLFIKTDDLSLKKFDMLLRKRFIFPKPKTPLTQRFIQSCSLFKKIILL